jgi:hypothetical protein
MEVTWNEMTGKETEQNEMKWNETYKVISIKHFQILKINNFRRSFTIS